MPGTRKTDTNDEPQVDPAELDTVKQGTPESRLKSFKETVKQNEEEHERMKPSVG